MRTVVNTEQEQAWNGYEGQHWADHHDRWNAVNAGFNEPLLAAAAIGAEDRVLDIGCGAGQTSRLAARRAARGRVLGLDLSGPELRLARELADREGLAHLAFEQGDAQAHPLPHGGFDVAISRFGIMFFADPVAAFGNIRRALRPGGRLAFVTMAEPGRNEWVRAVGALREHLPMPYFGADGSAPGMFSFADPARIHDVLGGAGFRAVTVTSVEAPQNWGPDAREAANFVLGSGPLRFLLDQAAPDVAHRAGEALTAALRPFAQPDGVHLRGAAWLVTATNPDDVG
ncbi:class I SAM-dependent methyltransferase [Streptomyces sp. NPDC046261]|uniref:class I SAM-dependent methyltransferase n=1 Tax=Streptomyces sp. NPDC046261 TaxID=3157200 RepID=UPI0033C30A75